MCASSAPSRARRSAVSPASWPSTSVTRSGRKPPRKVVSVPPDRAGAAGDEHAAAAEALLQLEQRRNRVAALEHRAPSRGSRAGRRRGGRGSSAGAARRARARAPVAGLHVGRARRLGLVDLRDDERAELAQAPHDRVEVELARADRQPLAEQAVRIGDVRDLERRRRAPRRSVSSAELLVGGDPEERAVRRARSCGRARRARCRR